MRSVLLSVLFFGAGAACAFEPLGAWLRRQTNPSSRFAALVALSADWEVEALSPPFLAGTYRVRWRSNGALAFQADVHGDALYNLTTQDPTRGAEVFRKLYPGEPMIEHFAPYLLRNRVLQFAEGRITFITVAAGDIFLVPGDRPAVQESLAGFDPLTARKAALMKVWLDDGNDLEKRSDAERDFRAIDTSYPLLTLEANRGEASYLLLSHNGSATEAKPGEPRFAAYGASSFGGVGMAFGNGMREVTVTSIRGGDEGLRDSLQRRPDYVDGIVGMAEAAGVTHARVGDRTLPAPFDCAAVMALTGA